MEDDFYYPFDGLETPDYRYRLKSTSLLHVRQVCRTQAERVSLSDDLRAVYANQAKITPDSYEKHTDPKTKKVTKAPVYVLEDIYDEAVVIAKMAEDLFLGFPKLVKAEKDDDGTWTVTVLDEQLFDKLKEEVVNRAFLDFRQLRNGIARPPKAS